VGAQPQPSQQATALPVGSPIEQAKNGTVAIEAPWGKGSGFFLTETAVITNKHVVEPDTKQLDEIRHKVQTGRKLIDLEREKLADARRQMARMPDGPSRRQLAILIQEREKDLARILPEQEAAEASLNKLEQPRSHTDIRIFLADGSEFSAQSVQASPRRDLALVTVYADKQTVLRPAQPNGALKQGDKVFAIGNPVGLRNTVTSGIFSGYRQHAETQEVFLQTDAAINPGNSGGPLIDERGQVHGVNTMILQNTEGIGFAIPIQAVFEEFSLTRE
jgi:S1-C subfamily serine protease